MVGEWVVGEWVGLVGRKIYIERVKPNVCDSVRACVRACVRSCVRVYLSLPTIGTICLCNLLITLAIPRPLLFTLYINDLPSVVKLNSLGNV